MAGSKLATGATVLDQRDTGTITELRRTDRKMFRAPGADDVSRLDGISLALIAKVLAALTGRIDSEMEVHLPAIGFSYKPCALLSELSAYFFHGCVLFPE
ncbi:MAG: hypothetical protein JST59_23750 [Actinobacteria bacterium]|nr:hypothetical protein [Actinomycetota bacterium]